MPGLSIPIQAPASYVPEQAMCFAGGDGLAVIVDSANPLPTATILPPATSAALAGSASASTLVGPFVPQLARAIWLTLSGSWSGSAQLLRSTDAGATRQPLTVGGQTWASFTGNCNEPVAEETAANATYYLALTVASGTVTYRVAQ